MRRLIATAPWVSLTFPAAHGAKLHSVDPLERLNGELKRRTDVDGIFPNEALITCLVGAPPARAERLVDIQRARYMTLETIARRSARLHRTGVSSVTR